MSTRVVQRPAAGQVPAERPPLRFETISSEESFARLRARWDELVRAMPRPSPFLLHGWLLEWWRHYGEDCTLAVEAAFRGDELVGALPLLTYSRRGLRLSTFLGSRQSALADALLAEDEGPELVESLVDRVAASEHDYVNLFGLSEGGRLASLRGPRELRLFERIAAPVLDLEAHGGWEAAYRAKTNSRKRAHHQRRRRQLAQLGRLEVARLQAPDELEPALEDAFRLHELRWRGRPDGSGFVTETGKRFNRAVLKSLDEIDVNRIVMLKLDGQPIAFSWHFLLGGRAYLHRLAFDPAFARCSPGVVNALDAIEAAADEGATRIEFLGGAERYKLELADRLEPLHLGLGLPGSALGASAVAVRTCWLELRRRGSRSQLARKVYDGTGSVRRRVLRPRDVLRPSGVRRSGD